MKASRTTSFKGLLSDSNWRIAAIGAFLGIYVLCHTNLYGISTVKENQKQVDEELYELRQIVKNSQLELKELHKELSSTKTQIDLMKFKEKHLLTLVDPWERCLRFSYATNCTNNPDLPCVLDILGELALTLTEALEAAEVTHWISYGTLLGAARDGKIIPWTTDVDIVIEEKDFKSAADKLNRKGKTLQKNGYLFFYDKKYPDLGRLCITDDNVKFKKFEKTIPESTPYYDSGYPYVDLYQATLKNDQYIVKFGPPCKFNKNIILPLSKVELLGRKVYAPGNYSAYLSQIYGPSYLTPPPPGQRHAHGAYSEACKNG